MANLEKKIDFVMFLTVDKANPNGDPLNGNIPRTDYDGYGEISDVCIKRKIRNRMQDEGYSVFVQSNDRLDDEHKSLEKRFEAEFGDVKKAKLTNDVIFRRSVEKWIDVRSFGQVITFQKLSIGVRGPVSISIAKSLDTVDITSMQITRSTNGMAAEEGKDRSSDTMGTKHYVNFGVYKVRGSINVFFAEKTGFSQEDAEVIKGSLRTLFVNDMSSARPEGSMEVKKIFWFTHPNRLGVASSAKTHDLVTHQLREGINKPSSYEDYIIELDKSKLASYQSLGLTVEEIEGL